MNRFGVIVLLCLFCIPASVLAMSKIERAGAFKPIFEFTDKIVCSGTKTEFKKILFIFDLNKTLMIPEDDSLSFYFNERFDEIVEQISRDLDDARRQLDRESTDFAPMFTELTRELKLCLDTPMLKSLIIDDLQFRIGDNNFYNLLHMLKTNQFKAIAVSNFSPGRWGGFGDTPAVILRKLNGLNVNLGELAPPIKDAKNFFREYDDLICFKEGVLFYGEKPLSAAIRSFLEALNRLEKWQPELIIFIDSYEKDLTLLSDGVANWNFMSKQQINFYGFYFYTLSKFNKKIKVQNVRYKIKRFLQTGIWMPDDYSNRSFDLDLTSSLKNFIKRTTKDLNRPGNTCAYRKKAPQ